MGKQRENLDVMHCLASGNTIPIPDLRVNQDVSFATLRGEVFYPGVNLFIGPLDGQRVMYFGEKDAPYSLLKGDIVGIHYETQTVLEKITSVEFGVQGG